MSLGKLKFLLVLAMPMFLSACVATPECCKPGEGPTSADSYDGPHKTRALVVGDVKEAAPVAMAASQPAESIVYFDFDESVIKAEWRDLLSKHAEYLVANPGINLILEGHCDERGTREYNIALGERRAKAVKRFLASKGLAESRLEIVSFGEEKPAEMGHDEAAWAKNRRVELKYK